MHVLLVEVLDDMVGGEVGNWDDLLNEANFKEDPSASNRIWIAGKPLEEWIEARLAPVGALWCAQIRTATVEVAKFLEGAPD